MMSAIAKQDIQLVLRQEQLQLLKDTICKGASDDEFGLFVQVCNRLRLDPFARQIYAVKRWDSNLRKEILTTQVSIDGFRVVAQRTGEYEGQTPVQWCGQDGAWREVWLADSPPAAARVGIHKRGFKEPLFAVARYTSYVQVTKEGKANRMWATMPDLMLAKCAEALALRKAFPSELSGVYTEDEMGQSSNGIAASVEVNEATAVLENGRHKNAKTDKKAASDIKVSDDAKETQSKAEADRRSRIATAYRKAIAAGMRQDDWYTHMQSATGVDRPQTEEQLQAMEKHVTELCEFVADQKRKVEGAMREPGEEG